MSSEINPKVVIPVALITQIEEDNGQNIARYSGAVLLNADKDITFTPLSVAASMISLYEVYLNHVEEKNQIQFEKEVKDLFDKMFEEKDQFMVKIPVSQITKDETFE